MPREVSPEEDLFSGGLDPTRKYWAVPPFYGPDDDYDDDDGPNWRVPLLAAFLITFILVSAVVYFAFARGDGSQPAAAGAGVPAAVTSPGSGSSNSSGDAVPAVSVSPAPPVSASPGVAVSTSPEAGAGSTAAEVSPAAGGSGAAPGGSPAGQTSPAAVVTQAPPPSPSTVVEETVTTVPTTVVPAEETAPPPVLSGNRSVQTAVQKNDGGHPNDIPAAITLNFFITRNRNIEPNPVTITVSGAAIATLSGSTVIGPTFDSPGGSATASGNGTYRGFATTFVMAFTISGSSVSGTLTIGGDGGLPGGQPLVLSFTGGPPQ